MSQKSAPTGKSGDGPTKVSIKSLIANFMERVQQDPQLWTAVIVGVVVGVILLIVLLRRQKSSARRSVLIVGPSDAGKTALFSQLVHGRCVDTYTSMVENSDVKSIVCEDGSKSPKTVTLVDLPGHDRLRVAGIQKHKNSARGVLYVVDASNVAKTIADSTEFLFRILSDPVFHKNAVPVMVVCNKSDLETAKSAAIIERELEKEINLLRDTHSRNILTSTDGSASVDHVFLGREGQDFKFAHLVNKVDFCEVSANPEEEDYDADLSSLKNWIYAIA